MIKIIKKLMLVAVAVGMLASCNIKDVEKFTLKVGDYSLPMLCVKWSEQPPEEKKLYQNLALVCGKFTAEELKAFASKPMPMQFSAEDEKEIFAMAEKYAEEHKDELEKEIIDMRTKK